MDLEGGLVAEPRQRADPIREEVRVGLAILALLDAGFDPAVEPARRRIRQVLLPEAWPPDAIREAVQVERPVGEVRQHRRGDAREVADQLALGDRLLA
jgi:hypothetical protein